MDTRLMALMLGGLVAGSIFSSAAFAQTTYDAGDSRSSQPAQRMDSQQNLNNGTQNGESGRREQRHMNREVGRNRHDMYRQRLHDRQHE